MNIEEHKRKYLEKVIRNSQVRPFNSIKTMDGQYSFISTSKAYDIILQCINEMTENLKLYIDKEMVENEDQNQYVRSGINIGLNKIKQSIQ